MLKARRRLAAIMFSDIVGYTSMMGSNEKKAFDILRKNRRIHWRLIKKYNGRLLKEMGDGILAIFSSSTEAVVCALAIQQAARALEIPLRIGIHQGDVVFEKKDVLGDGVNIASRIQSLADVHGIVISGNVYKDVRNKEGLESESLGEKSLKGVADKTQIYRIWSSDDALLDIYVDTGELIRPLGMNRLIATGAVLLLSMLGFSMYLLIPGWMTNSEKSILVLPFDNYTGTDTIEYFIAGMHDALTTELGKINAFRVLSQSTARAYKEMRVPLSQIAREQDVDYVVEGSLMCLGENICFQPKLLSVQGEEKQIWSGNYTNDISEVLNLYHQVTKEISREINVLLTPGEVGTLEERKIVNPEAYRLYLQGRRLWLLEGKENLAKSIEYYERALEIDPDFALAYVGMAITYTSFGWYIYEPNTIALPKAEAAARKALELDNTIGEAHTELALSKLVLNWDWQGSEQSFKRAIDLNPSDARAHNMYAWLLAMLGRHEEAITESKIAYELDPLSVAYWTNLGRHYYFAREYKRAIEEFAKVIDVYPDKQYSSVSWYPRAHLALTLFQTGNYDEAIDEFKRADYEPSWYVYLGYLYTVTGETDKARDILNHYLELYKNEPFWGASIALIYAGMGDLEKTFEWLEKAFEQREGWMPFIQMEPLFDALRDDPRFIELCRRMNFPE